VAEHRAAALSHPVDLALLHIVAGTEQGVCGDHAGQHHALATDTRQQQAA
jgi:hypothetical protein